MNFLAHLYLACLPGEQKNKEGLVIGNFIADSVKGNKYQLFDESIRKGILMHRAIDFFSDNNPVYLQSVHRLRPVYGKYSGIITDMFYDHFLALEWNTYSPVRLKDFCNEIYTVLSAHKNKMPEESRIILKYMIKNDWLHSYKEIAGIRSALEGMSKRMKYYFPMDKAVDELEKSRSIYQNDFSEFFPLLIKHIEHNWFSPH